ncbi:unnamed protein product [Closterium sp. Naga37s-1]|nr:unnamed protein product [Closterium sp. Naga37s-1]
MHHPKTLQYTSNIPSGARGGRAGRGGMAVGMHKAAPSSDPVPPRCRALPRTLPRPAARLTSRPAAVSAVAPASFLPSCAHRRAMPQRLPRMLAAPADRARRRACLMPAAVPAVRLPTAPAVAPAVTPAAAA